MTLGKHTSNPEPAGRPSLYGILARQAPRALILRRGPSKWVQAILWHTNDDSFEYGQWFHGRIYEQRCDLSPDGSLFIYFALKINRHTLRDPEYTFAWTAISKPPYLTALALWPQGDTYYGGGLFMDERVVELAHHPAHADPHPRHPPRGLTVILQDVKPKSELPAFARPEDRRLKQDRWELLEAGTYGTYQRKIGWTGRSPTIWQKLSLSGRYRLLKAVLHDEVEQRGAIETIIYTVEDIPAETYTPLTSAEWADWDHRDRLVFARDGRLYAAPGGLQTSEMRMLADFNGQRPYELRTPKWAQIW